MKNMILASLFFISYSALGANRLTKERILAVNIVGSDKVTVLRYSGKKLAPELPVVEGDEFGVGDEIHTAAHAVVVLRRGDGSSFVLGPDTKLRLEARVPGIGIWNLQLKKGALHGEVAADVKKSAMKLHITSASGIAAISDADFLVSYTPDKVMHVYVRKGEVLLARADGSEPATLLHLKEKMSAELSSDFAKAPEPAKVDAAAFGEAMKLNKLPDDANILNPEKKLQTLQDCILRAKGWRETPGEAPYGECY